MHSYTGIHELVVSGKRTVHLKLQIKCVRTVNCFMYSCMQRIVHHSGYLCCGWSYLIY